MCAGWGMGHAQRNAQDLFNIAPKRPNWDLKRELDKKLGKLERRTQESIHTLIRTCPAGRSRLALDGPQSCAPGWLTIDRTGQRLAAQKGDSDDLVGAMRAQEEAAGQADDSSDDED